MRTIFFAILATAFLIGCTDDEIRIRHSNPPDQGALDEKAKRDFAQKPIVKEFAADGIEVDCDASACRLISNAALEILKSFKPEFVQRRKRIESIYFSEQDYPHYDYRWSYASLPAKLTAETLKEFFEVLNTIQNFEKEIGYRVEFPNNRHLKKSIEPLLEILKANVAALKTESKRLRMLVMSSVYNQYNPHERVLMFKIDDLKVSFAKQWDFATTLFKAQDLFGTVQFLFDLGDDTSLATMNLLFKEQAAFKPLLSQLQGRRVSLLAWNLYGYGDIQGPYMDLGVSNQFDGKYLAAVFQDQIRVQELSRVLMRRIMHSYGVIDLSGHDACLTKIESLKDPIKAKLPLINDIMIASGEYAPTDPSSLTNGTLNLNCNQTTDELRTFLEGIK